MSNKGVKVLKACLEAWKEVQDDAHPVNYIVLTFSKKKKNRVEVRAKGAGGLDQALEHVTDEEVFFVGCRVSAIDTIEKEGSDAALSIRPRFVKFCFVGKDVKGFARATQLTSSSQILAKLKNTVLDFKEIDGIRKNIQKESLEEKLDNLNSGDKDLHFDWTNSALMKQMHLEQYDVTKEGHVDVVIKPKKKKKKKKKEEEAPVMLLDGLDEGAKEDDELFNFRNRRSSIRRVRTKSLMKDKLQEYTNKEKNIDISAYGHLAARMQSIDEMMKELTESNTGETNGLLQICVRDASNLNSPKLNDGELPCPTCQILIWRTSKDGKKFAKLREQTNTCNSTKSPSWNSALNFRVDNISDLSIMLSVKHQSDTKSFLLGRTKPLHVLKDIDTDIDIDFFDKYSSDWNTIDLNKGGSVTFKYEWSPKNCGLYHRLRLEKVKKQDLLNNVKNRLISHHVQTQELKKAQQKFYHKGSIVVPDPYGFLDLKSNRQTFDFSLKEDIGVNMGHEDWDTQIVTGVNPKSKCGEKYGLKAMSQVVAIDGAPVKVYSEMIEHMMDIKSKYTVTFETVVRPVQFDDGFWPEVFCLVDEKGIPIIKRSTEDDMKDLYRVMMSHKPLVKGSIHAWNVAVLDDCGDDIRIGLCDDTFNLNGPLGNDTHSWAYSTQGKIMHNNVEHPHKAKPIKNGQSVTVIADLEKGKVCFDCWDFSGDTESMLQAYSGLNLKGTRFYVAISFGKPGQRVTVTSAFDHDLFN